MHEMFDEFRGNNVKFVGVKECKFRCDLKAERTKFKFSLNRRVGPDFYSYVFETFFNLGSVFLKIPLYFMFPVKRSKLTL